ncbi:ubiquinone anaerobic biosynthesis accessory factor UbiT [Sediminimonas qiaohouensis]|uniref:ubiquinone anaerobic biosynthesis accessory factor UbiT n=1 Tax=Sediminimonas qiaohouensis TaxID=552061 RepID=UPI0004138BE9|nr:SCP2 sterol-binding domain-containing protein [Sediminimonas qiaohouensis]
MPPTSAPIPLAPRPLALGLRALPLFPLAAPLSLLMRRLIAAHPGLITRLGAHGSCRFAIDPIDLPLVLLLQPEVERITVHRRPPPDADTRIAGPLAALLGLVHGTWDGDALFFSRDLVIEGDTGAALALRNAIDDAELDLAAEIAALSGPMRGRLEPLIALAERVTHLPLRRAEGV